ncbi:phage tail tape measure protein [Psychrobacillus sp. FSL K6-1464]|uniref:phage tail tape measure protein n=1 Tax=Psychrobacillus sp. FSL K6-1464 TaxID=2921545 RepID=UPI0030FB1EBE
MSQRNYEIAFELGARVNSSMRSAFANANNSVNDLNRNSRDLNNSTGRLSKGFSALRGPILAVAAGATSLVAGMGAALKSSSEFADAMGLIEARTDESIVNMAEIKKISKNLYQKNMGEDWADLGSAISSVQSVTKLSGKELERASQNAILYRDVFGEDITQSVKASDTMMRNFGITSDQAYNLLSQGAKKGLNKSDELLDSANEYSPYFSKLGFSADQMFSTFSAGLENGAFNLDKVGDAVKEFNIRAKDGSKTSIAAFKALGMNSDAMMQTFAKGGPKAQESFQKVVQAISSMEDPVKKNETGVALFGTQFEDLEADVIAAMGTVKTQFDMTKESMDKLANTKIDTIGEVFKAVGRTIDIHLIQPIGVKLMPTLRKAVKGVEKSMPIIQKTMKSVSGKSIEYFGKISSKVNELKDFFAPAFLAIKGIVLPILLDAVNFIIEIWSQIKVFWDKNGAEILQAVKNVFSFIIKVVQVLAPVVLFILKSLWNNVKGVIQGALNIILGLVKVFSALFTGNWSGIWEGVKKILGGAVQFLWNLWNLMMVGKLVKSVGTMVKGIVAFFKGLGPKIATNVQYYYHTFMDGFYKIGTGIFKIIWNAITAIVGAAKSGVSRFITIFQTARTYGVNIFMSLVSAIRNLFASIISSIGTTLSTVISGAVTRISGFIGTIKGFMSGLLGSIQSIFTNIQIAMLNPFNALSGLVTSVTSSVSGLVSGLFIGVQATGRGAINALIMSANAMIGGINKLKVNVPDWVPEIGGNSIGFSIPNIPMLAKGGVTTGATLAMIGEGKEQEAVLPLSKLDALLANSNNNNTGGVQFHHSPTYIIQGNTSKEVVEQAQQAGAQEFKQIAKEIVADKKRLSFNPHSD